MSIRKMSIMFSRANTLYQQIKAVAEESQFKSTRDLYSDVLKQLDKIYSMPNTRKNMELFHDLILEYSEHAAKEYRKTFDMSGNDTEDYYLLKEE